MQSKKEKFLSDIKFFKSKNFDVVSTHANNYLITIDTPLLGLVDYWSSTGLFMFRKTGQRGRYSKYLVSTIDALGRMKKEQELHWLKMTKAKGKGAIEKMAMSYLRSKGYEVINK